MKFVEIITDYITKNATGEEILIIETAIKNRKGPQINPELVMERLIWNSKILWEQDGNKLMTVKYVKNITGWGLKEAKDWCDTVIFPCMTTNQQKY